MRKIIENSFYYLVFIYAVLILLISLGFISKFILHFEIFALVLALVGILVIDKYQNKKSRKERSRKYQYLHYILFILAIVSILIFRIIPYLNNNIPIGYDAGIYKYAIEHGLKRLDNWIVHGVEPGFLYLMEAFKIFFSSDFILIWLFIIFNILLGIAIYFFSKEYFSRRTGIIAILIYSVSVIQFKVFEFMYYKNIIALSLMLFSLIFLKRKGKYSRLWFIILAALIAWIHKPSFYLFSLAYLAFIIKDYKNWKINSLNFLAILALGSLVYLGKFKSAVIVLISPVLEAFVNPGLSPGSFVSFFSYQFSTLSYLPFAVLGFLMLIRKKQFNILFFLAIISAFIVYFQFFFFNRFIIFLDVFLIILAGSGFNLIIENKKKFGIFILSLMLISSGFLAYNEAINAKPGISQEQLDLIKNLQNAEDIEENAYVISISSEYSPWVLGYSGKKTIAPGLFDYDSWNEEEWKEFWSNPEKEKTIKLMSVYNKPIYLFAGDKSFNNPCFQLYLEKGENKIYKYIC